MTSGWIGVLLTYLITYIHTPTSLANSAASSTTNAPPCHNTENQPDLQSSKLGIEVLSKQLFKTSEGVS
jgi:hypothetical protein